MCVIMPVGFRFHPTEEEIIDHFLAHKLAGRDSLVDGHIGEIDHLYQKDPWDIPGIKRALVLCKLKDRADKSAADLPNDEGEASRFMGSDFDNNAAETNTREVDASWLLSLINSDEDINFSLPLQSQIHAHNSLLGEDDQTAFADSFLNDPDEYGSENAAFSLPSSNHAYEEPANLYGGHGDLKIARQLQMARGDDILLMGASSMGSTTATRHEHIESTQSGGEVIPITYQPRPPAIMPTTRQPPPPVMAPKLVEHEKVSHKGFRLQGSITRSSVPKAAGGIKESSGIAASDKKIFPVTNAKPRSNDNDRKGRFIHFETTISSHRSCPPSVYLLNAVLGLVLFLIILREALIVH
ncbi:hypothetical protein SADUNF_Sadunf14G0078200 [Salix dunnii]|uniref:NAC domain-containing protein n=1 Tax=Salix dunnii TaxID=1413687 RepID=A0A835JGZ4_9ROSI|nr:hypothetical protein SADUNF_Sadunf14G0078200 [Salix dunnii]